MWNLAPPPGFQGLDPDKPLQVYYRHLPHWRQDGAAYFVTFRLRDGLPQEKLRQLRALKAEWERRYPVPRKRESWEVFARQVMERTERWLDQGMGCCILREPWALKLVVQAMHHFDESRYELGCYVVMPNHVHAIVRPLIPASQPLERILQSWKRFSSRNIHSVLRKTGNLWQDESFDRIIRDEEHLYRAIQYIGRNPERAGLANRGCIRWVRPSWAAQGWRFEEGV
jgi:REP element-mobilizing transposase RayT